VELRPGGVPLLHDLPALEAMQTYPHVIGMLHREEFWNAGTSKRGQAGASGADAGEEQR
jgi:hypothetical protein